MTVAERTPTVESALAAIDKAWDTVSALCAGRMRWEMRVPAEPDHDPDLVIGDALRQARALLAAQANAEYSLGHPFTCEWCAGEWYERADYLGHFGALTLSAAHPREAPLA